MIKEVEHTLLNVLLFLCVFIMLFYSNKITKTTFKGKLTPSGMCYVLFVFIFFFFISYRRGKG